MKSKKRLFFLAASLLLALASCGGGASSSSTTSLISSSGDSTSSEPTSSSTSSEPISSSEAPSSSSSSTTSSSSIEPVWHDYTKDGTVVLGLDYAGHSFWKDGVEAVSLKTAIDGDTAHFNTSTGEVLKARFYGIDTPESTGQIQPWGKPASYFTKEKLENAAKKGTIVISSPKHEYGLPEPDTTGERYVSLVWINEEKKNAPLNELYLLNLDIVQNGLSWVKALSQFPEYTNTFIAAENQAKVFKLCLHGDEPDPYYNYGGYLDTTLLDIKREVVFNLTYSATLDVKSVVDDAGEETSIAANDKVILKGKAKYSSSDEMVVVEEATLVSTYTTYNMVSEELLAELTRVQTIVDEVGTSTSLSEEFTFVCIVNEVVSEPQSYRVSDFNLYDNFKARIQGTVAGFADHVLYLQNYYTEEECGVAGGEYAGINIFTGMGAIPSKFTTKNAYIQVCGTCTDSENFGFQMSSASFPTVAYSENDAQVLIKPADNTDERKLVEHTFTKYQFSQMINNLDYSYIYCAVRCSDTLTVSGGYKSTDGDFTLYFSGTKLQGYLTFPYTGNPDNPSYVWKDVDEFKDKNFMMQGIYVPHKTQSGKMNFQINPTSTADFVWVK